jgi:hypothetical protein
MRSKAETLQTAHPKEVTLFNQKKMLMSAPKTKDRAQEKQSPCMVVADGSECHNSPDDSSRHIRAD